MNIFKTILNFVPGILKIPFYIGSFLYLILLPDITYYALGIYLDIWIPALRTFWGFPILFILLMIPFVSTILVWLLTFQSFWVLFKFLIGSYYPRDELLGFVTMYPATVVIISYTVSYLLLRRENYSIICLEIICCNASQLQLHLNPPYPTPPPPHLKFKKFIT